MNEAIKAQLDNLTKIYQEIREILLRIQIRQTAMCSLQVNTTKETTQQLNNQDEVIGRLLNVVNTLCVQNNCPPSEPIPEMPPPPVLDHVAIFNADIMARGLEPLELTETMGDYFAEGEDFAQFLTRTDMEECNVNLLQELSRIESEDPSLIVF
jgi:valyl-tRNA synthetase